MNLRSNFILVFIQHHLQHSLWYDLPANTEFVFEPPALLFPLIATRAQLVIKVVDFLLILTVDLEANSWREFEPNMYRTIISI